MGCAVILRAMTRDRMAARIQGQIDAPTTKRRYVRSLFGRIAGRYDLTNDLMSMGRHRAWKRLALDLAEIQPGHVVLDLAAGTGDFAIRAAKDAAGATVIAADLTWEMMVTGKSRPAAGGVQWAQCDATYLPFPDGSIDRVLVGYGLRNFPDLNCASGKSGDAWRRAGDSFHWTSGGPSPTGSTTGISSTWIFPRRSPAGFCIATWNPTGTYPNRSASTRAEGSDGADAATRIRALRTYRPRVRRDGDQLRTGARLTADRLNSLAVSRS